MTRPGGRALVSGGRGGHGGLTVLVHSAGITRDRVTWRLTPEDWGGDRIPGSGRIG